MKKTLDSDALKTIYKQYKNYLLPSGIIIVSLLLFFYLIIPQIANFTDLQKQMEVENQKLQVLKSNINYLSSIDPTSLDSNFKAASLTLPKDKDFVGVLSAINEAAGKGGISMGDYQFKVGDLDSTKTIVKGTPFLEIDLNIDGNSSDMVKLIEELEKTAPINEVIGGGMIGPSSTLTVRFYYSPLPPVNLQADTAIRPINANDQLILKSLLSWNNLEQVLPILPQGTSSGALSSSPF